MTTECKMLTSRLRQAALLVHQRLHCDGPLSSSQVEAGEIESKYRGAHGQAIDSDHESRNGRVMSDAGTDESTCSTVNQRTLQQSHRGRTHLPV